MHNLKFVLAVVVLLAEALAQSKPTATLTASNPSVGAELGTSVAISGSTVAAGAPLAMLNGQVQGIVYVFTKPATAPWTDMTESAQLFVPNVGLGSSVGISGDGSVIVAVRRDGSGIYVFSKPAAGWTGSVAPVAMLTLGTPPAPWFEQGQLNGLTINSTGTTVVAGAPNAAYKAHFHNGQPVPALPFVGAAYLWVEPPQGWASANGTTETATLVDPDGAANDLFGEAVATSANTIVIGAAGVFSREGAAYLFQKPTSGWLKLGSKVTAKLTASDEVTGDRFGSYVAVGNSGALVAVGSVRGCSSLGSAYLFAKPSTRWPATMTQTAELAPNDFGGGCFGQGIAVVTDQVIVGSPQAEGGAGADYSFAKPVNGWTDTAISVSMVGGSSSQLFGTSNSIGGRTSAAGAPETSVNSNNGAGAVYLFSK